MINISLCILAKNESHCIFDAINSTKGLVNEVLVVDDHSTDDTASIAALAGANVKQLPFTVQEKGFAIASNWMHAQAQNDWILFMDADEILGEGTRLHTLSRFQGKEVWALPRRKWIQYPDKRTEYEKYPDWQVRFFKRNGIDKFVGEMHIRYICPKISYAYRGPHIEHLQEQYRTVPKLEHRNFLYPKLAAQQGVAVIGGDVLRQE